jgi:hypothetical protein
MGRFSMSDELEQFCKDVPLETFLRIKWRKPRFPPELVGLFPLYLIYYREKPGKTRMLRTGWNTKKLDSGKFKITARLKKHKKSKTGDQNNFSVYVHYANTVGELGTIKRIVKHKGHGKLVAAFQPTQKENESMQNCSRLSHRKYKNFNQLYLLRREYTPEFKELTDRLEIDFKCNASGQTRLF